MAVEYRDIPGFEGYRVGDDGSVWSSRVKFSTKTGEWKRLRVATHNSGYLWLSLRPSPGAKQVLRYVHHLVLEAFVGPRPEGMEGCHDPDHNPANNRLDNLRWATPKENGKDRAKQGRQLRGSKVVTAKLSEEDVAKIFSLRRQGMKQQQIGDIFGVKGSYVSAILRGERWKHCSSEGHAASAKQQPVASEEPLPF